MLTSAATSFAALSGRDRVKGSHQGELLAKANRSAHLIGILAIF
jgi:hypothetical protein